VKSSAPVSASVSKKPTLEPTVEEMRSAPKPTSPEDVAASQPLQPADDSAKDKNGLKKKGGKKDQKDMDELKQEVQMVSQYWRNSLIIFFK